MAFEDLLPKPRLEISDSVLDTMVANSLMPPQKNNQATYIEELGRVNPEQAGIAVYDRKHNQVFKGTRRDGTSAQRQDADVFFSIQSMSKLFNAACYADNNLRRFIALKNTTGVDPSSNAFNVGVLDSSDPSKPANAFENIGALAVAAAMTRLHPGQNAAQILANWLTDITGANPPIEINMTVAESEFNDALNNQKLLQQLEVQSPHIMDGLDRMTVLRNYCMQCSIEMTCAQLAKAVSIFIEGKHPETGEQILSIDAVERCQVMMASAGGYNQNLSAKLHRGILKSGVGGGLVGLTRDYVPFATFSPKLNEQGNSIEGIKILKQLNAYHIKFPKPITRPIAKISTEIKKATGRRLTTAPVFPRNRREESEQLIRATPDADMLRLQVLMQQRQVPGGLYEGKIDFYMKEWDAEAQGGGKRINLPSPPNPEGATGGIPSKGRVLFTSPDTRPDAAPNDLVAYVHVKSNRAASHITVLYGNDALAAQVRETHDQTEDAREIAAKATAYATTQAEEQTSEQQKDDRYDAVVTNVQTHLAQNEPQIKQLLTEWASTKFTTGDPDRRFFINLQTVSEKISEILNIERLPQGPLGAAPAKPASFNGIQGPAAARARGGPAAPAEMTRAEEWEIVGVDQANGVAILAKTYNQKPNQQLMQRQSLEAYIISVKQIRGNSQTEAGHALFELQPGQRVMLSLDKTTRMVDLTPAVPVLTNPVANTRRAGRR